MIKGGLKKTHILWFLGLMAIYPLWLIILSLQPPDPESDALMAHTKVELVDWHISGLWIINSPVAWIRVTNYNQVPIHDITLEYSTFAADGHALDKGTYTIEGSVPPGTSKNFIELYLGLVDLYTERLAIKPLSMRHGH